LTAGQTVTINTESVFQEVVLISASEIKRGLVLEIDKAPWLVIENSVQTPSARGASTLVKLKIKNLKTGQVLAKTLRSSDMIETADCERREAQFLYRDGEGYVFMDQATYEQFTLGAETLGSATGYLTEGIGVRSLLHRGEVIEVELPFTVELEVVDTSPVIRGATAQAQLKPATLQTGIQVMVPAYLTAGEKIRVDTRDGHFVGRANE
jgi:elongation factor P